MENLYINARRYGYTPQQAGETLTVGELMEILRNYDEGTPVYISNDNGYTYGYLEESDVSTDGEHFNI